MKELSELATQSRDDRASAVVDEPREARWRAFYETIDCNIAKFGVHIQGVGAGGNAPAGFTYTIGLSEKFGFEVIVFALPMQVSQPILNHVAAEGNIVLDVPDDRFANFPVYFKKTNHDLAKNYGVQAEQYYMKNVEFVQMVLCDRNGLYPWDEGFSANLAISQPLLF